MSKIYRGWHIAVAGFGMQLLQAGLLNQAFGAYASVLAQERGWSKTALAGGAALQSMEGALLGPIMGWLSDRFGPRAMVQAGVLVWALGFAAFSQIESITSFYGAMLVIAVGASLCGYFPFGVAIVHWFSRWRTRAVAIMTLGLAAGGLILPVVSWGMETYGWRRVALGSAVLILLAGWPLACVVRRSPAELGLQVDGAQAAESARAQDDWQGFTAAQALRTRAFWLIAAGHALALLVVSAVNVHALLHMRESLGLTLGTGALVIAAMTASQGAGILVAAAIGDRWSKRYLAAGCMLAHMLGLLALTYAQGPLFLALFAVLHGGAWGLRGPIMQTMRADYFGLQSIGMVLGLSAIASAAGLVSGPLIAGALADATGSYRVGFTALALIAGSGAVLFAMASKPRLEAA